MTLRLLFPRLLILLALWMLAVAAGCGIVYLDTHGYSTLEHTDSLPRTRPHSSPPAR